MSPMTTPLKALRSPLETTGTTLAVTSDSLISKYSAMLESVFTTIQSPPVAMNEPLKIFARDTECYSGYESVAHLCEVLPLPPWFVIFIVPSLPMTSIPVVLPPFAVIAGALTALDGL